MLKLNYFCIKITTLNNYIFFIADINTSKYRFSKKAILWENFMKKIALLGITTLALLSLAACSSKNAAYSNDKSSATHETSNSKANNAISIANNLNLKNVKDSKDKLTDYEDNAAKLKNGGYVVLVNGDLLLKDHEAIESNLTSLGLKVSSVESTDLNESFSGKVESVLFPNKINFTSEYLGYWYFVTPKGSNAVINYYK